MINSTRLILLVIFGIIYHVDAGEYYYYNSTSNHYYISQLGVNPNTTHTLRLEIRAAYDQLLRLVNGAVDDSNSVYVEIVFNHKYIGIRDTCEGCAVKQVKYVSTFDVNNSKRFWLQWNDVGKVTIGLGYLVNQDIQLTFQPDTSFTVQYITVRSFYQTGYWTILKDDPPIVLQPAMTGQSVIIVNESVSVLTSLLQLDVVDPENDTISVDSSSSTFSVSNFTLLVSTELDYEQDEIYIVTISFRDLWNEVNVTVIIHVTDVIDEPPVINIGQDLYIMEELAPGRVLPNLFNVTDKDSNDSWTYLLTGQDRSYFSINSTNGMLTVVNSVDRDGVMGRTVLGPFTLHVEDSAGLMDEKMFNLTVVDINDNSPTCSSQSLNVSMYENGTTDTLVLTMNCTDLDEATTTNLSYSVNDTNFLPNILYFNESDLLVDSSLVDFETLERTQFYFIILVSDSLNETTVNTARVQVNVQVVGKNEFTPIFNDTSSNNTLPDVYMWNIMDVDDVVASVVATDEDRGDDGRINYNITQVTADGNTINASYDHPFIIDHLNGEIRFATKIDSEIYNATWFLLDIMASDMGHPQRNRTTSLKITIRDVTTYRPMIEQDIYHVTIPCSQSIGSLLTFINISNFERQNMTNFTIAQNMHEDFLSISSETGNVYLKFRPNNQQLYRTVAEVAVYNTQNPNMTSTALMIIKFDPCGILPTTRETTAITTSVPSKETKYYSLAEFVKDLKVIGVQILCGVLAAVLICIGVVYLVKTKLCRKSTVHPFKVKAIGGAVNQGKSQSQLSSNMSVSTNSTLSTRCSSVESLRLV